MLSGLRLQGGSFFLCRQGGKGYRMSDNLNLRRPQDSSKISLTEAWEIRYWTHTLGVTESQLRAAVAVAGHGAAAVRRHLGK